MTKVNLLPDYIWEGKRRAITMASVAVLLLLEILGLLFWVMSTKTAITQAESERVEAEGKANEVDKINQQAQSIEATIKPTADKTTFVEQVVAHNNLFPALFERTNLYTYYKVGYRQLQPAQTVLNMTAYTRSVSDIGRYLLNIQRAKDTFTTVSITSQMPGWPFSGSGTDTSVASAPAPVTGPGGQLLPSSFGPYGPGGGGPQGFGPAGAAVAQVGTAPTPQLLEFTAVGQLAQKFQIMAPVYGPAGATDASGGGTTYGSPGPYGPAGQSGGGYSPPPGSNGPTGGAAGGSNGG